MYRIFLYQNRRGERAVESYLSGLEAKHRQKIGVRLQLLAQEGPNLKRPFADVVEGPMRELRVGFGGMEHRVLYYFVRGDSVVLLHAFTKKTQAIPPKELDTAWRRMEDLNRRLAAGEELA